MDQSAHLDLPETMAQEEKMERLGQGVLLERADQEDCLVQEGLLVHLDSLVLLVLMVLLVQKETWDLKESQDHLASKATPEVKVSLVHKAP